MFKHTKPIFAAWVLAMSPVVSSSPAFAQGDAKSNQFWWPEQLDLSPLRQHGVVGQFAPGLLQGRFVPLPHRRQVQQALRIGQGGGA